MTRPDAPAGWYPDPSGVHELRYFNGQWTPHVCTQGVSSINPLEGSPAPAVSTRVSAPEGTPNLPETRSEPEAWSDLQSAPRPNRRSPKVKLVIAGCVVAVAVGVTVTVWLRGNDKHGSPTPAGGGPALASAAGLVPTKDGLDGPPGTRGNWTQSQWETVVGITGSSGNHLCVDRALALNLDYDEVLPVVKVAGHHSLTAASMQDLVAAVARANPDLSKSQAEVDAVEVYSTTVDSGCPGTV
ncbi:MAG TPA: DUF2510 domain-containing protein [Jatrophihabitans sp.]|nr:DUF2510 domain-containing protein [Jatrophihabitans sp.]